MTKRINEAAFLKPWAMKEDVVIAMKEIVDRHLKGEKLSNIEIAEKTGVKKEPPAYEVVNGTARIPVYGIISKRMSWIQRISQPGTSTLEIEDMLQASMEDPEVKRILLDIDSPGGSSDGILELSDYIFELRGKKEIVAFANGQMCSAAYWIGSAAEKIYASRGAVVGSIGVYAVVDDFTHANWAAGVKTEVIKAGRNKAVGHPDKPFTQDDREVIQKEVNDIYSLFVESVARNRGISTEDVLKLATGDIFIGKDAVENGLVDGIKSFGAFLSSSAAETDRKVKASSAAAVNGIEDNKNKKTEEVGMDLKVATVDNVKAENKAVADALITEGKTAGIVEGKEAGLKEGKDVGLAEGKTAGTEAAKVAEKVRVDSIMSAMPPKMEAIAIKAIQEGATVEAAQALFLKELKTAAPVSAGANAEPEAGNELKTPEEKFSAEFKASAALQAEFGTEASYIRFKKAEAAGTVKIFKK